MYEYKLFTSIQGPRLNLKPLQENDIDAVIESLYSPTTWVVVVRGMKNREELRDYLYSFLESDAKGEALTLVVRSNATQEVVALSRFHRAGPGFLSVEIGSTWISDRWMRTFVNTEKKYLMVQYAFEKMGVKRVEFSVDPRNDKSNQAMKRLGATLEGTLRKWRFRDERDPGDRNIYSIIDDEWGRLKGRFKELLKR